MRDLKIVLKSLMFGESHDVNEEEEKQLDTVMQAMDEVLLNVPVRADWRACKELIENYVREIIRDERLNLKVHQEALTALCGQHVLALCAENDLMFTMIEREDSRHEFNIIKRCDKRFLDKGTKIRYISNVKVRDPESIVVPECEVTGNGMTAIYDMISTVIYGDKCEHNKHTYFVSNKVANAVKMKDPELLAAGDSEDVADSIRKFLMRSLRNARFLSPTFLEVILYICDNLSMRDLMADELALMETVHDDGRHEFKIRRASAAKTKSKTTKIYMVNEEE